VDGAPFGYQGLDITPSLDAVATVSTFDVLQLVDGKIVIAAVCADATGKQVGVYCSTFAAPTVSWNISTKSISGFDSHCKYTIINLTYASTDIHMFSNMDQGSTQHI
jgi:hypothetical protein